MNAAEGAEVPRVLSGTEITPATLLGVCTSLKPAPGRQGGSATRSLLSYALGTVAAVYPDVSLLDLRDHPLPSFDGRTGPEYQDANLDLVSSCVQRVSALLVSVPAYWCGVSGVFKNFIDTLCGPSYDLPPPWTTVFAGKSVGLLVVGADDRSGLLGAAQAVEIMKSTGATVTGAPVVVCNPRHGGLDAALLSRQLLPLAAGLAAHAHNRRSLHGAGLSTSGDA